MEPGAEIVVFSFNGRSVRAIRGDTVADALTRAKVHVFTRSLKFHRPRGLYCGSGRCYSCVMRVNGVPGVRTCATMVEQGMVVESERGFPTTDHDMFSVLDHIFRKEFDYHTRFIRPSFMTPLYQRIVRRLASSCRIPDSPAVFAPHEKTECAVLIVGNGISGSVAHARLQSAGVRTLVIDRKTMRTDGPSFAFGFYEGGEVGILTESKIHLIKPKALLLATGRAETGLPIVNGDLPGIMLPEAVHRLSARGVRPGSRAVLVGSNELVNRVGRELDGLTIEVVDHIDDAKSVICVKGRRRVSGIEVKDVRGARRSIVCDLVVPFGPLVPCIELAQQAGCGLDSRDGLWHVKVDETGRTTVPGVFASGGLTGLREGDDRIASGEVASSSILRFLGGP